MPRISFKPPCELGLGLHTLALWNGTWGNACAFIYHADKDYAHITWRGTWDLELSPCVERVWQRVAFEIRSSEFQIHKQRIHGAIWSHGDAIHYLDLPIQVRPCGRYGERDPSEQHKYLDSTS